MGGQRRSSRYLASCLAVLGTLAVAWSHPAAQQPGPEAGAAVAALSAADREAFLANAKIVSEQPAPKGTTNTRRVTLSDGTLTHDASVQTIDEAHAVFESNRGTELNFKDSWRFNVAAYRLDRLLDINMIPATVERRHNGKPGSYTWWVDDVLMDEQERYRQKKTMPDTLGWNQQMWITRMFDQLIANVDRNLGNLLIDRSYRIWMIDHSRAFRLNKEPRSTATLSGVDRGILERLRQLAPDSLAGAVGDYLNADERAALLGRRDRIVSYFDQGGGRLLFDRKPR